MRLLASPLVGYGHGDYPSAATRTVGMQGARADRALAFRHPTEQPFRRSGPFDGRIPRATPSAARAKCPRYRASSAVQDAIPPWGPVLEDGLSSRWAISCYGWRIDVELDDKLSGHDAEAQVIKVAEAAPYSREIKLASIPERRLRRAAATNKDCVGQ